MSEREERITLIQEANNNGARLHTACEAAGVNLRTYRRWFNRGEIRVDQRPLAKRPDPSNKLSEQEVQAVLDTCNTPEFASLPPSQIVPTLLDRGTYMASESTFYRVLNTHNQLNQRGRNRAASKKSKPSSFAAYKANEVWTWDITYLPTRVKGQFYYLYMFEDIFSRKIVGYEVHEHECGEKAAQLIQRCILNEQCFNQPLVLHSDNGAPMKAQTMKAKLEELGVQSSHSRPRVSNDNAYSESTFRTLKYRPNWPSSGFIHLSDARDWVQDFVNWYNNEHKHSKINFVTPAERHAGKDQQILARRREVLEAAKAKRPNRWSKDVRNCKAVGVVMLNPDKPESLLEDVA